MTNDQKEVLHYSKQIMHLMEEIVGGAAHEINNLLFVLSLSSEVLENSQDPEDRTKALAQMDEQTQKIALIMKGLRSVMKNSTEDVPEPTSISDVSNQVIELCKTRFNNHRIIFKNNVPEDVVINCRGAEVIQAFLSILNSSHDAVLQNETNRWISFDIDRSDSDELEILISDSGPKVDSEEVKNIFSSKFDKLGRKGLPLILAKSVIESHGGTLTYVKKAQANTFKITFPEAVANVPTRRNRPKLRIA